MKGLDLLLWLIQAAAQRGRKDTGAKMVGHAAMPNPVGRTERQEGHWRWRCSERQEGRPQRLTVIRIRCSCSQSDDRAEGRTSAAGCRRSGYAPSVVHPGVVFSSLDRRHGRGSPDPQQLLAMGDAWSVGETSATAAGIPDLLQAILQHGAWTS
ncbi:hypothetical protein, partial [Cohnella soli]